MPSPYNKKPPQKPNIIIRREIPYSTVLFRDVPRTKLSPNDPKFDKEKCWHCQDFDRIKANPDVIVWCERCYILQFKKFDGTYIQHNTIPAMKQLHQDIVEHKFVDSQLKQSDTRIIDE